VLGEGFVIRGAGGGEIGNRGEEIGNRGEGRGARGEEDPISNLQSLNLSISQSHNLHLLTDAELFGWSKPQARARPKAHSKVAPELFFADVKPGEHVVHIEHGIGKFEGLTRMELAGIEREYLLSELCARATSSTCPCIRPTASAATWVRARARRR
jgi:hypothetical protein